MINFSNVKIIAIPEGEVKKIEWDGIVLWQKSGIEIISDLLNYADWGSTSRGYIDGGWHDFSDDSSYEDSGQMDCIYCGAGQYSAEAEESCPGNTGGFGEWATETLTLYNPENILETYQITYDPNEGDMNIPTSKIGWLFKGDDEGRAESYGIYLNLNKWFQTTADSVITMHDDYEGDGPGGWAFCGVTNVYEVSVYDSNEVISHLQ